MVIILNQIMGQPTTSTFSPWMFKFILVVLKNKEMIDCAKLISDNLHERLTKVRETRRFYMTSYLVYVMARRAIYPSLTRVGTTRIALGQVKMYVLYPQLDLKESIKHYKRVNNAFLFYFIRTMEEDLNKRLYLLM